MAVVTDAQASDTKRRLWQASSVELPLPDDADPATTSPDRAAPCRQCHTHIVGFSNARLVYELSEPYLVHEGACQISHLAAKSVSRRETDARERDK